MRAAAILLLLCGAAQAQAVHDLVQPGGRVPADAVIPMPAGSCLWVNQSGTDAKQCDNFLTAIGRVPAAANTVISNAVNGTVYPAANAVPACPDVGDNHLVYTPPSGGLTCSVGGSGYAAAMANPTGLSATTSLTPVMMGLAGSQQLPGQAAVITPSKSGKVYVSFNAIGASSVANNGVSYVIRYGTGTPPNTGSALAGTAVGTTKAIVFPAAVSKHSARAIGYVTGLAIGTQVWFDVAYAAVTGGSATLSSVTVTMLER